MLLGMPARNVGTARSFDQESPMSVTQGNNQGQNPVANNPSQAPQNPVPQNPAPQNPVPQNPVPQANQSAQQWGARPRAQVGAVPRLQVGAPVQNNPNNPVPVLPQNPPPQNAVPLPQLPQVPVVNNAPNVAPVLPPVPQPPDMQGYQPKDLAVVDTVALKVRRWSVSTLTALGLSSRSSQDRDGGAGR
jgi:hypothetical protein